MAHTWPNKLILLLVFFLLQSVSCDNDDLDYDYADDNDDHDYADDNNDYDYADDNDDYVSIQGKILF